MRFYVLYYDTSNDITIASNLTKGLFSIIKR